MILGDVLVGARVAGRVVVDALCSFFYERDRIDVSWQIFYFTVFWPC